ncbi:HlyD family efflux transporter periplasmic adaptor subunit [Microbacterium sp. ANT_H45B]|uniref:HlyD family secretion protein n=1 Tax=Microbacterium sp. ANT_H45B TaxID=2597346 RepID=UPI0011F06D3D|nr:HlyD family efflux transporter periplasmic adaptor subunit [Microbacterium sp. ANT_H45B]KAA0961997.1 HlyD family efflux transporter periplasmic adaptor subunit [Microbacterium sp. ANT_H45B]
MRVVPLGNLTDSRLLYEKRPPIFGFIVVALVLTILTVTLFWSLNTIRPSVVTAAGAIQGADHATIVSSVSGRVSDIQAPNGSAVEAGVPVLTIESTELAVEAQTLHGQRDSLVAQADLQARFTDAVSTGSNDFNMDDPAEAHFGYQYESLQNKKSQLRIDRPSLEAQGYTAVEIDNAIKGNRLEMVELDKSALAESTKIETDLRTQIKEVDIRLGSLETGKSAYTVTAGQAGEVYLDARVTTGSVISAGTPIGTISSTENGIKLDTYLSVTDRQFVDVGDEARVTVSGLPATDYGNATGKVVAIDSDVTTVAAEGAGDSSPSSSYFVAQVEIEHPYITSNANGKHQLVNGTAVEVSLTYNKTTYFEYFLHLLGLK